MRSFPRDHELVLELVERLGGRLATPGVLTGELAASGMVASIKVELRPATTVAQIEDLRRQAMALAERELWRVCECSATKPKKSKFGLAPRCANTVTAAVAYKGETTRFAFVCGNHARVASSEAIARVPLDRRVLAELRARAERESRERWRLEDEKERLAAKKEPEGCISEPGCLCPGCAPGSYSVPNISDGGSR